MLPDDRPDSPHSLDGPHSPDDPASRQQPDAVDVYWRPGCVFCRSLLHSLESEGVTVRLHNIWEDEAARSFVRSHNGGDETVPTVAVGSVVSTNPGPRALIRDLRSRYPHLVAVAADPPGLLGGLKNHLRQR